MFDPRSYYSPRGESKQQSSHSATELLNDTQRAQAALVTVLPSQPTRPSSPPSSHPTPSPTPSPHHSPLSLSSLSSSTLSLSATTVPFVLKIVLPATQANTSTQIRRIPLSPHITLLQLMASVMSVCQLSDPFLLRWDGPAGESVLLKRDEQLRALVHDFGRSNSSGSGGVFKLHVVHKSRRTSRSSTGSPVTDPTTVLTPIASPLSASIAPTEDEKVYGWADTAQLPPSSLSLDSTAQHTVAAADSVVNTTQWQQQSNSPTAPSSSTVLLVMVDQIGSRQAARALTRNGFHVETAVTGEDAIERFTSLHKSLLCVLMAVDLPGLIDGVEATRRIRQLEYSWAYNGVYAALHLPLPASPGVNVPIYALLPAWSEADLQTYEQAGLSGCILKGATCPWSAILLDAARAERDHSNAFLTFPRIDSTVPLPTNAGADIVSADDVDVSNANASSASLSDLTGSSQAERSLPQQTTPLSTSSPSSAREKHNEEEKSEAMAPIPVKHPSLDVATQLLAAGNSQVVQSAASSSSSTTGCCTCSPVLARITGQLADLSAQMSVVGGSTNNAPVASCYSETALLTLTAMVESLGATVESLSIQLQEAETERKEAQRRNEERRAQREARQAQREAEKAANRWERQKVRQEERDGRKAMRTEKREGRRIVREQEQKERETVRRLRDAERTQHTEPVVQVQESPISQPQQQQQQQQQEHAPVTENQHQDGEAETDDMFAAAGSSSRPPSPALSAASEPSFASSPRSSRRGPGDISPSLSEEEMDVLAPMLESARPLSPSSSAYFLCPPASHNASAAFTPAASSRLDGILDRLESEGYGVRSLNALVLSEHGGEEADWNVVVRDLDLYYAQG